MNDFLSAPRGASESFAPDSAALIRRSATCALRHALGGVTSEVPEADVLAAAKAMVKVHCDRTFLLGHLLTIIDLVDDGADRAAQAAVEVVYHPGYEAQALGRFTRRGRA